MYKIIIPKKRDIIMQQEKALLAGIKFSLSTSSLFCTQFYLTIFAATFGVIIASTKVFAEESTTTHTTFFPLTSYTAQYQLKSSKYKLSTKAIRKLTVSQKNVATLEQNASIFIAKIEQKSSFFINEDNCEIIADSYHFHQSAFGKKKDYRIDFDYEKNQFTEKNNNQKQVNTIKGKLYDELSYQEALRCELKNRPAIKIGQEFSYIVRTKGKNKNYTFIVNTVEKLETDIGTVDSIQLSRVRDKENEKNNSYIWFSKQHDYLLVKFKQEDDDDTYGLDIKSLELQ